MRWSILALLVLAGCSEHPWAPYLPPESHPFDPSPVHVEWWTELEELARIYDRPISGARFHSVPGDGWHSKSCDCRTVGVWIPDGRIYIAEERLGAKRIVQHEMLHHILNDGSHDHFLWRQFMEQ